jgi:hypothetical protein
MSATSKRIAMWTLLAAAVPLAACADRADAPLSPSLGAAVASMDVQIIDPTPAEGIPEGSGAKAALAIRRYETGRVKPPPSAGATTDAGYGSDSAKGGDPEPASNPGAPK